MWMGLIWPNQVHLENILTLLDNPQVCVTLLNRSCLELIAATQVYLRLCQTPVPLWHGTASLEHTNLRCYNQTQP